MSLPESKLAEIELEVKVVLLGESLVGKTSISTVAFTGEFQPKQLSTVGASYQTKLVIANDYPIKLCIWDTAGQERFRSLIPMFYRDANFAILVYSIDNMKSFLSIQEWYKSLQYDCPKMPHVFIVGNKLDLEDYREVSTEEGIKLAQKLNATFFELSAKTQKEKVEDVINEIAKITLQTMNNVDEENVVIQSSQKNTENPEKSGCC